MVVVVVLGAAIRTNEYVIRTAASWSKETVSGGATEALAKRGTQERSLGIEPLFSAGEMRKKGVGND